MTSFKTEIAAHVKRDAGVKKGVLCRYCNHNISSDYSERWRSHLANCISVPDEVRARMRYLKTLRVQNYGVGKEYDKRLRNKASDTRQSDKYTKRDAMRIPRISSLLLPNTDESELNDCSSKGSNIKVAMNMENQNYESTVDPDLFKLIDFRMAKFVYENNLPCDIVQCSSFVSLIELLRPPYQLPSPKRVLSLIRMIEGGSLNEENVLKG